MAYEVQLLAFSKNPDGDILGTFRINLWRSVQTELARHRMFSLSFASSRAIPTRIMVKRLLDEMFIPQWTKNSAGMAGKFADKEDVEFYNEEWLRAQFQNITSVLRMITRQDLNINDVINMPKEEIIALFEGAKNIPHKGDINRLLESGMSMEGVVSGTAFSNFFFQRVHKAAHPALQEVAYRMAKLYYSTQPKQLEWGEDHLPFISENDIEEVKSYATKQTDSYRAILRRMSAARCGRISFGKDGEIKTIEDELNWFHRHIYENASKGQPPHVSPAEHPSWAQRGKHANFTGFKSLRSTIPGENHTKYCLADLNRYEEETGREITTL